MLRGVRVNKHTLKFISIGVLAGAVIIGLFSFGLVGASGESDTVATVDGQAITREQFYDRLEQESGQQVLQQMIAEKLILSTDKVSISDVEMSRELSSIKANYASEADFQQALNRYNITPERLQQEIRMNLRLRKLAAEGVTISEDEIKSFFEANKESLGTPQQVKASHILVDSKEEADKLLAQLKKGADFAALAKENSKDSGSAKNGGDLGYLSPSDQIVPEFKDAVFAMKVGENSAPIKTQFGYHIIRVTAISPAKPAVYEQQHDYIKAQLTEEKSRSYDDVVNELRKTAKVKVSWERYNNLGD